MAEIEINELRRTVVLGALDVFYCPLQLDDIRAYAEHVAPSVLPLPEPGQLVNHEASRWRSGQRGSVWICPALTDGSAVVDCNYLTRSDWSCENRLLTRGGETRHVWLVRVLCDQWLIAEEEGRSNLATLVARIRYHGEAAMPILPAKLVGLLSSPVGDVDAGLVEELREVAEDAHAALAAVERPVRLRLARDLERLDDYRRLFGSTAGC